MPATPEEKFNPTILNDASPEAVEMKPALAELLPQLLDKNYSTKLNDLPAYQAFGRIILPIKVAWCWPSQRPSSAWSKKQGNYRIRWGLAEVLTALLRTTLTLTEADYLRLFASYGLDFSKPDNVSLHVYPFPLLLTLGQVAKLAKREPLGEPMLTFCGSCASTAPARPATCSKSTSKPRSC